MLSGEFTVHNYVEYIVHVTLCSIEHPAPPPFLNAQQQHKIQAERERERERERETYSGSTLAVVAGLHPPEQRHTIARLSLQFPESNKLWNKLGLLVQADTPNDPIKTIETNRKAGGRKHKKGRKVHNMNVA